MSAKTFDAKKNFDLSEKYDALLKRFQDVSYDSIPPITILQTIAIILKKECTKKQILKLKKNQFIKVWDDAIDAIEKTVDYFKTYYRIPVSKLLPYNGLIIPFAYFFYHNKHKPTGNKQKYMQDFFWRCSLTGRYSSALETKLAQDIKRIDKILNNELPKYDFPVDVGYEFVQKNGAFSAGRAFIKAILCLYAYKQPKSFNDGSLVILSNDYLKQANSKNYHHFFPKAYLKKKGEENHFINHVLNITLVDDFLNKKLIGSKSPAVYMKKFVKQNDNIKRTMRSHLINIDNFGIWKNDYDKFFISRARAVSRELKKRILPNDIDTKGQKEFNGDYEEAEVTK